VVRCSILSERVAAFLDLAMAAVPPDLRRSVVPSGLRPPRPLPPRRVVRCSILSRHVAVLLDLAMAVVRVRPPGRLYCLSCGAR